MPHDNVQLAQAPNGEIGPRCKECGTRLTFGNAMVIDNNYYCLLYTSPSPRDS